jgi:hypothetical protein
MTAERDIFEQLRDIQEEMRQGTSIFDQRLAELRGQSRQSARRAHIQALVEQGATEGERAAARAALARFDVTHAEMNNMQRGGNWIDE